MPRLEGSEGGPRGLSAMSGDRRSAVRFRFDEPVLMRALYAFTFGAFALFCISTIPGVRSEPGYDLLLDGWLNNICYMLSALVCWLRARNSTSYQRSWQILAVGLAFYGAGNIYWTIAIRTMR